MATKKCTCNIWMTLLALVLLAISTYLLVMGFATQFNGGDNILVIVGWYFVGFIVLVIAKICKWKGHTGCPVHGSMYGR